MVAFIDAHRAGHWVESICRLLPIALSKYYEHKARQGNLPPAELEQAYFRIREEPPMAA